MLRTLRLMKTSLKNWLQTFSQLFHVTHLLESREILKLELRRAERVPRTSTETVTFIAFVVTFFKSTKLVFVSWAKLLFMMHVQSFCFAYWVFFLHGSRQIFKRTKTCTDLPYVYTGPARPCHKFLNGKQYCSTAICSRICTVPRKRFAWETNCPLKHFTGAV